MIFVTTYLSVGLLIAAFALWQCRHELVRGDLGSAAAIIFVWPMVLLILVVCLLTDEKKTAKVKS